MKPVGYICEPCEILTVELIQRIEEAHEKFKIVGIGIHSDNFFVALNGRKPIKKYADRAKLVSALKGVDFVFELDESTDLDSELNICSSSSTGIVLNKPYHVGYAPGTYDLFHEGHLEHLTEAKMLCDILVVGVNGDSIIWDYKKKHARMHEEERSKIVRNLGFVDYVFVVEKMQKSTEVQKAAEICGAPVDVLIYGSDLRYVDTKNDTNLPVIFTERDPEVMKHRSSTFYRKAIEKLSLK